MCTSYVIRTHFRLKIHLVQPSFYRCTDSGRLEEADCPRGLFWSSSSSECEFPDNATCEVRELFENNLKNNRANFYRPISLFF